MRTFIVAPHDGPTIDRRWWSVGLIASPGAFALTLFVVTFFCGMMQTDANEPGEPANEPYCVPAPHPVPGFFALVYTGGVWLAWRRIVWPVIGLGALMTATSILFMFSLGYFGLGPALLVLVAGFLLLGMEEKTRRRTPRMDDRLDPALFIERLYRADPASD